MFSRLVSLAAIALLAAWSADAQNDGVLTFWGDSFFKGEKWQFHRTLDAQYCYNDNVGKPSSIKWKNQLKTGSFNGKAKIAFYTEHDCKGTCRSWFTTEKDFPVNLAIDRINDKIKSFMIWQTSKEPSVLVHDV
ncbi:hypothetical protein PRIC1_000583 [Phytophthora ramorum]|uniref:Uncharacterized protein n=1 Tax=Phytophthora ramorum TaxID=164328 RepID=H3GC90_PHYRM